MLDRVIWDAPLATMPARKARLVRFTRLMLVLGRDLLSEQRTLRAMGLVYTTLLSIVPLLALTFSVLKAFGVYNQIGPALHGFLAPLGENADEINARIIQFIQNMNVGVLGSVGLALLLYTSVSLVQKVEEAFNRIWHIAAPRSMGEWFSRYLSVLMVRPILIFSATGITATATNLHVVQALLAMEPFGRLAFAVGKLLPYVLVIVAFSFLYMFVPNSRVRLGPALAGGAIGGVLWQSAGWAFASFVASAATYSAIYSSFAILVLFMIWLYVSWLILLFGASVAFYRQHPEYVVAPGGEPHLSNRMRERVALVVMSLIADHYHKGRPGWTMQQLSQALTCPHMPCRWC
jgi:membrane protein